MIHWDTTINLGNIVSIAVFLITLVNLHKSNKAIVSSAVRTAQEAAMTAARIELKVNTIWDWFIAENRKKHNG